MIFITGGNGLVGSAVIKRFLEAGITIRCLKREHSDLSLLDDVKDKVEWVEGDILDIKRIETYLDGIDTIIHCAAMISFQKSRYNEMYKVNVEGTRNLVNTALARSIKAFGYISSIATIGKSKTNTPLDETNMWVDSPTNSGYSKTKYLAELEVWRGMEEGLQGFIVNPSIILGSGHWQEGSTKLFKYAYDQRVFYPQGNINYVDVSDVAEVVFRLYKSEIYGERYILNAGNESYKTFLTKVAQSFNKRAPSIKARTSLALFAYFLDTIRHTLSRREPLLTIETLRMSRESNFYDSSKVTKALNFNFKDLDSTINAITRSLKERYDDK